jgi:hypothetical protein
MAFVIDFVARARGIALITRLISLGPAGAFSNSPILLDIYTIWTQQPL